MTKVRRRVADIINSLKEDSLVAIRIRRSPFGWGWKAACNKSGSVFHKPKANKCNIVIEIPEQFVGNHDDYRFTIGKSMKDLINIETVIDLRDKVFVPRQREDNELTKEEV